MAAPVVALAVKRPAFVSLPLFLHAKFSRLQLILIAILSHYPLQLQRTNTTLELSAAPASRAAKLADTIYLKM